MPSREHPRCDIEMIRKTLEMALTFLERTIKGSNKVVNLRQPKELQEHIDMKIEEKPFDKDRLIQEL